jgi:hypothetical protein
VCCQQCCCCCCKYCPQAWHRQTDRQTDRQLTAARLLCLESTDQLPLVPTAPCLILQHDDHLTCWHITVDTRAVAAGCRCAISLPVSMTFT